MRQRDRDLLSITSLTMPLCMNLARLGGSEGCAAYFRWGRARTWITPTPQHFRYSVWGPAQFKHGLDFVGHLARMYSPRKAKHVVV